MPRRVLVIVGAITLAGALLRFTTLGTQSFWYDEAATAQLMDLGFGEMISEVADKEATPPGYFALAWIWTQLFGNSEVGLRSL